MRLDPHSYADTDQPQTRSIDLTLRADFDRRVLEGEIALHFRAPGSGPLNLDTRDLRIDAVTLLDGTPLPHDLFAPEPILGARLRIDLPRGAAGVRVRYATSPAATALQWLEPSQTAGGQPFLYSQAQPIHARSLAPLQDTPRIRITVGSARFTVPSPLRALMAAAARGRDVFEMPQAIPPYLLAFAVGDLTSRQLSGRSAVWAERAIADAAAKEFAEVEQMLLAAEELFGPYEWDRFDILVMPPSFPYGGMENPRLTFVTPSLLAGDRSLVNVIAHELAHAWTGNLVTNASANDFWLNEGFTVYAERRILEALHGRDSAELHAAAGLHDLHTALERFAAHPELTCLRNDLRGIDPDEAYSSVPRACRPTRRSRDRGASSSFAPSRWNRRIRPSCWWCSRRSRPIRPGCASWTRGSASRTGAAWSCGTPSCSCSFARARRRPWTRRGGSTRRPAPGTTTSPVPQSKAC